VGAPQLYGPTLDVVPTAVPGRAMSSPAHVPVVTGTVLGKRPREAEDTHDGHQPNLHKKGKGRMVVNRALEAAEAVSTAHQEPAARNPAKLNEKPKTAECGAGRLAATTAQEVYHQFLPGSSVQQVLVGATAPQQLTWVEGCVAGGSWHHHSSMVQQESEGHSAESEEHEEQADGELFGIPRRLKERQQALLAATQADWERKAVDVLKCRLCPGADFSDWEDFKRHCDTAEAHPVNISYCGNCGDFCARRDALKRHCDKPPGEWMDVTADIADWKRSGTDRVHKNFEARLELYLRTGEKIEKPFSTIVKDMYPESSKEGQ
jgi:hypothetical protein